MLNKTELQVLNNGADLILKFYQQIQELEDQGAIDEGKALMINPAAMESLLNFSFFCYSKIIKDNANPKGIKENKQLH